jgi:RNA-directed DNA polymerase
MGARLRETKRCLQAMRHDGLERQGQCLAQVLRGCLAYYAVPMSAAAITAFRHHMIERWLRVLRRRSKRNRRSLSWGRMKQIAERYLRYPRILHPWPEQQFLVTIQGKSPVR